MLLDLGMVFYSCAQVSKKDTYCKTECKRSIFMKQNSNSITKNPNCLNIFQSLSINK